MAQNRSRARTVGYLTVGGLAVAGTLVGQLGATSATTYASGGSGGLMTGLFLALMLACAGTVSAWVGPIAARWGSLRVFAWTQMGVAVSWSIVGVVEIVTDTSLALLLLAAPIFGVLSGLTMILTPFVTRSYVDPSSMTSSLARRGVVSGIAAMIGASIGGFLIHATDPGIGILANGLLTIPLAVFTLTCTPLAAPKPVQSHPRPMHYLVTTLRANEQLRQLALLVVAFFILVVPMLSLIVPILNNIDHAPLPSGAGLVFAGIAAGRLLVPYLVRRVQQGRDEFAAALWVAIWATGFMIAFAISTTLPLSTFDLVVWTVIGVGIGASRFTFRPLVTDAGAKAGADGDEMSGVATLVTVGTLVSPFGMLMWGFLLDAVTAPFTIAACAVAMIAAAAVLAGRRGRAPAVTDDRHR